MGEIPPEQKIRPDVVHEANPMQEPMQTIAEVRQMDRCARSVALIEVTCYRQGKRASTETGTGWLIAPGLVLTCWHVVATLIQANDSPPAAEDLKLQIEHMLLSFNHIEIGAGGIQYKVKSLEYPLNESNSQDFAVLRLEDRSDRSYQQFGYLPIELDTPFTERIRLSIIQHPLGQTQQIPITPGHFVKHPSQTVGRIFYTTPTDRGTSGAPVLNCYNWRAVALHNGENREVQLREGTCIKYILSELQDKKPDLYNEIIEAQRDLDNSLSPIHLTHPLNPYVRSSNVTFHASFSSTTAPEQKNTPSSINHQAASFSGADQQYEYVYSSTYNCSSPVSCLAFHPDGHYLASGDHTETIKIWDVPAKSQESTLKTYTSATSSLTFSLDGKHLALLSNQELAALLLFYASIVSHYLASFAKEDRQAFRDRGRGTQGQTQRARSLLLAIQKEIPDFSPPTLREFSHAQGNDKAKALLIDIKELLLDFTVSILQNEFGEEEQQWWSEGIPYIIRQSVLQKCDGDKDKLLEKEKYLGFQDYMAIIEANWNLFKGPFGQGNLSRYSVSRVTWLRKINDIQDLVNHDKAVTSSQLDQLEQYNDWLRNKDSFKET